MNEGQQQNQQNYLIECLTQYLQYLKTVLSAQLGLIQSFLIQSKSIHNNPTFVISKIQSKQYHLHFQNPPFKIYFVEKDKSSIERFYLRITQFLQYRLSPLKNLHDEQISKIMSQFQKKLVKLFKQISSKVLLQKSKISLGFFLQSIDTKIVSFIYDLLNLVTTVKKTNFLVNELVQESYKLIQSKFQHLFQNSINGQISKNIITENRSFFKKNKQILNSERKIDSNRTDSDSVYKRNSSNTNFRNYEPLYEQEQYSNNVDSQFGNQGLNSYLKKEQYYKMFDVMEIQSINICSKQYILKELIQKNKKNSQLIDKFLKKYKKKLKNHRRLKGIVKHQEQEAKQYKLSQNLQNNSNQLHKIQHNQRIGVKFRQKQQINSQKGQNVIRLENSRNNKGIFEKQNQPIQMEVQIKSININQRENMENNKDSFCFKQIQKNYYEKLKDKLLKSNKQSQQIIFKKHVSMKGKNAIKIQNPKFTLIQSAIKNQHFISENSSTYKIKHSVSNSVLIADQKFPGLQQKSDKKYISQMIEDKKIYRQKSTPNKKQKDNSNEYSKRNLIENDLQTLRQQNLFIHLPLIPQSKRKILSQK